MKAYLIAIPALIITFFWSDKLYGQSPAVCIGSTIYLGSSGLWSSSNTLIATVDPGAGIVTGVSAGTVTITRFVGAVTDTFPVTVKPLPVLTSALAAGVIPDSTIFNYMPASSVPGTAFTWYRPYIPGIYAAYDTGSGNPLENLYNTTHVPVTVPFHYYLEAAGCIDTGFVTVIVDPTPMLSSTLIPTEVLDTFTYHPSSYTPGATYAWNRSAIAGITPATSFGADSVFEVLHNSTSSPITVTYDFKLGLGAFVNSFSQQVRVIVKPYSLVEVNEIQNNSSAIKAYPNPTQNSFTIDLPIGRKKISIFISDIMGKTIKTSELNGAANSGFYNIENLSPGTYVIKVIADGQVYQDKVVIW